MKKLISILFFLFAIPTLGYCGHYSRISEAISAPQDKDWGTIISDGETGTTDAYDPFNATGTTGLSMDGYTGIQVRAKFTSAMGTDPVVACFGKKGSDWAILRDENGATEITLSDDATIENNVNDDTSYWTDPSTKIDAMGAESVLCTVTTAGVSAGGSIVIEAARY